MKNPKLKTILLSILAIGYSLAFAGSPDKSKIKETLETLRTASNAHDYGMLKPSLDDDFTYEGRNSMMSTMIMRQIVNGYPQTVNSIDVVSISPNEDGWSVAVRLEGKDPSKQREIKITGDYLILQADIADIQVAGHGEGYP